MLDLTFIVDKNWQPVGYAALISTYSLKVIPHHRQSYITQHGRSFHKSHGQFEIFIYAKNYEPTDPLDSFQQLEFAIKYDGINLSILKPLFLKLSPEKLIEFILDKPNSKYRRKIWFLYEYLQGIELSIDNLRNTPYIDLLDPKKYFTGPIIKSKRHAVNANLIGNKQFCPFVRKSEKIIEFSAQHFDVQAQKIMESVDPVILYRASHYLYTKETKSSFGIEKISPDLKRTEKFIKLLETAPDIKKLTKELLINLQNAIVDAQFQDHDYRSSQNYVGELTRFYQERIHYISPKPEDLSELMSGYLSMVDDVLSTEIHPVCAAAVVSFGFVFLHPFEDGNGRIHRFLIHFVLAKLGFTPENIIFPVSAVMLRSMRNYDQALESFSRPLLESLSNYTLSEDGALTVYEETKEHYQFIDYTQFVEYLFECIATTLLDDFSKEIEFIQKYDKTKSAIQMIIDMPDLKIDKLIRCISQNQGILGKDVRKKTFNQLTDDLVNRIEKIVRDNMLQ